jgi:hypothetical protein
MKISSCGYAAVSFLSVVLVLGFAVSSFAQTPAATKADSQPEKKQTLNFEDELVTGASEKPELFYLFQKKNFNYRRLIRLRENFLPEMRRTSEEVQRARGGD